MSEGGETQMPQRAAESHGDATGVADGGSGRPGAQNRSQAVPVQGGLVQWAPDGTARLSPAAEEAFRTINRAMAEAFVAANLMLCREVARMMTNGREGHR